MTVIRGDRARALLARSKYTASAAPGRRSAPKAVAARPGAPRHPRTRELRLDRSAGHATSAAAADHASGWVHALLAEVVPPRRADKAAAVTAELVLNALAAAKTAVVRVHATTGGVVLIEVFDSAPTDDVLDSARCGRFGRRTGRGLRIVNLVSVRWGVRPGTGGKCVWAQLGEAGA